MNSLARVLLALALVSSPLALGCKKSPATGTTSPSATDALTFPLAPRVVGTRWAKVDDLTTSLVVETPQGKVDAGGKRHYRTESEILAVDAAGLVTKLSVSYPERVDLDLGPSAKPKTSALLGNTYVVALEGGAMVATRDGQPVTGAELVELTKDQDDLGKAPVMEQIMAGRPWKLGERYQLTADDLARLAAVKGGDGPQTTAMALTLREVVGSQATFALTMTMQSADRTSLSIDISGTMAVDTATGRPGRLELSGPVKGNYSGLPITGTMTGLVTYEFATP